MRLLSASFLCTVIFLSMPMVARSDEPDKDPKITQLREDFIQARRPTPEDLHFGDQWACDSYSAEPKSKLHSRFEQFYSFEQAPDGTLRDHGDPLSKKYEFNRRSLVGEKLWGQTNYAVEHVRVENNGKLIVEYTAPECKNFECLFCLFRWASADYYRDMLLGYRECERTE